MVAAPSCFTKLKGTQVERELTDREMMTAFDIEEGTQAALSAASKFKKIPLSQAFVLEAPIKVLYMGTTLVINKVKDSRIQRELNKSDISQDTGSQCGKSISGLTRKRSSGLEDRIRVKKPKTDGEKASEVSQVSTKNDDAPVNIDDWDIWSVNNYQHPENITGPDGRVRDSPTRAMVCIPGSYSVERHGRLFDALQRLLI